MRLFALALSAVLLAGCGNEESTGPSAGREEGREDREKPGKPSPRTLVDCGEGAFPLAALRGPPGAERAKTPPARALRAFIEDERGAEPVPSRGWRLLAKRPTEVLFGAGEVPDLVSVVIEKDGGRWTYRSSSYDCELRSARRGGSRTASWRIDPQAPPLTREQTEIPVLVLEESCAGGGTAEGRVEEPDVLYAERAIVVTYYIKPLPGPTTCPGHPATPARLQLDEPLRGRQVFDGSAVPPRLVRVAR